MFIDTCQATSPLRFQNKACYILFAAASRHISSTEQADLEVAFCCISHNGRQVSRPCRLDQLSRVPGKEATPAQSEPRLWSDSPTPPGRSCCCQSLGDISSDSGVQVFKGNMGCRKKIVPLPFLSGMSLLGPLRRHQGSSSVFSTTEGSLLKRI